MCEAFLLNGLKSSTSKLISVHSLGAVKTYAHAGEKNLSWYLSLKIYFSPSPLTWSLKDFVLLSNKESSE